MNKIRTRFAPSPTGVLHVGGARTALFNYLFAKKNNGVFVLRIEDTDKERSKPEFEKDILDSLEWLGIKWDEGPAVAPGSRFQVTGSNGYRQSEKIEIYKKYLEKLLKERVAYYCFCSEEELESERQYKMSIGETPVYSKKCAKISVAEAEKRLKNGEKAVIRLRAPIKKIKFQDTIRGEVEFDSNLIGDFVIAKNLESPLYHFSVVVDDYEMKISHVIRGEEHLSNTPRHILLQEALGFTTPKYGHLPLILAPDRTKLSKRQGAVSVFEYKKIGYLPEAIINFIAFLGWNPGDEKEIYSLDELAGDFDLEKIQKAGAIFNIQKLDFINSVYIKQKTAKDLAKLCLPYFLEANLIIKDGGGGGDDIFILKDGNSFITIDKIEKIVAINQEKIKKLPEIVELSDFFFKDNLDYPAELLIWKNMEKEKLIIVLEKLQGILLKIEAGEWDQKKLEETLLPESERLSIELFGKKDRGCVLWPLRAALSGKKASAGPFDIAAILGKEKTLKRIEEAKNKIQNNK